MNRLYVWYTNYVCDTKAAPVTTKGKNRNHDALCSIVCGTQCIRMGKSLLLHMAIINDGWNVSIAILYLYSESAAAYKHNLNSESFFFSILKDTRSLRLPFSMCYFRCVSVTFALIFLKAFLYGAHRLSQPFASELFVFVWSINVYVDWETAIQKANVCGVGRF